MDLHDALTQIAEIRQQMARTETFRGYRAGPVALSGAIALTAAALQPWWVGDPSQNLSRYLTWWLGAAGLSILVTAAALFLYCRRSSFELTRSTTLLAVGQLAPCVVAGGMLTVVLVRQVPQAVWLLPGLWSVLFSLGIFASFRLLPGAVFWVGAWYLSAGLVVLAHFQEEAAFFPWVMGLTFGVGQLLAAAILYWTLERNHE